MLKSWIVNDINRLLFQLSEKAKGKSRGDLKRITGQPNARFIGAFDYGDVLVGIAAIHFYETLMRKTGIIEDMIVDEEYRGKGIGDALTEALIKEARKEKVNSIDLTSNSKRIAAIAMYKKHGFKKRETNCCRLEL